MLPDEVNQVDKYIEAENCRHVVASLIPEWEEELEQEQSLCRTWPVLLGDSRGFASELEGKRLDQTDINEEQNENNKKGSVSGGIEPGKQMEEDELETLLKMDYSNIQSLPIPTVPNVPDSVIEQTMMTPFRRCNVCSNCLRHKQRKYPCLAIEAVKKWDEALGGVDGQTVAAMATKLTKKASTHGMRVGKGMKCGECRNCRIKGKSELCMTMKAVRDGGLPDRLKPAAGEALKRRRLLGIAFDPYAEKKSGRDMLLSLAGDEGTDDATDTEEERWGVANVDNKILKSLRDEAKLKKKKKYHRWNCKFKKDGKSICGVSNNENAVSCIKCKAVRWSGDGGQLEVRVAAILEEGQIHIREPGKFQEHIKERIIREHGQGGDELDISLDDVTHAIQKYEAKKTPERDNNRPESYKRIAQIGRAIRNSDFGDAIMRFDESVIQSIREIAAFRGVDLDLGPEPCSRGADTDNEEHDSLPAVLENLVSDIKYSASLDDLSNALFLRNLRMLRKSLLDLYQKSGDQIRLDIENFWSCPGARKQFIRVVKGSAFATVQSVLSDSIQRSAQFRSDSSDPIQANAVCSLCGGLHSPVLPVWRAHPIMAKISDNRRALDYRHNPEDTHLENASWRMENVTRNVRYPLYHLVEHVLNTLSLKEASSRIPVTLRPFPRRRFIESTKVPAFPALPVDGTNWFNLVEQASILDSCIPDNKKSPMQIYRDVEKERNKKANSRKLDPQSGTQPRPGAFKVVAPAAAQSQPLEVLTTNNTSSLGTEFLREFPKDVQLIFEAASEFGIQRNVLERAAKRFKGLNSL